MNESKLGYLVKIISIRGKQRTLHEPDRDLFIYNDEFMISLINKIGMITYVYKSQYYNKYNVRMRNRNTIIFYEDEVEILYDEPTYNSFFRCFWCNGINSYSIFKKERIYYCPKCLR